ncbi:MAG: hypothetical protein ACRBCI_10230 [Cellvibrionaceae bacterium]
MMKDKKICRVNTLQEFIKKKVIIVGAASLLMGSQLASAVDVNISGYVRGDFIYDVDEDLGDELGGTDGALDTSAGADSESHFRAHARESRLAINVKPDDSTSIRLEGDFFGSGGNEFVSNSRGFRLRHAVGTYKNITAGQTWSTFMDRDFGSYPTTVDFTGSAGIAFVRQALLRVNLGNLDLAIENPQVFLRGDAGSSGEESLPDFVARYARAFDNAYFYVSGVVQSTEVSGGAADGESESYFGASAGGNFKLGDSSTISAAVISNAGRYGLFGWANPTFITVNDKLETLDYFGYNLTFSHKVANGQFNITYGNVEFDDEFAGAAGSTLTSADAETIQTVHVNYIYNASKNVTYMFEVSNLDREDFSGDSGDNTRYQFAAKYSF